MKIAAVAAVGASKPTAVLFGKVTGTGPLLIQCEQKLSIDQDFIIPTSILETLTTGDQVILLQVQGGQDYIVLDKVVQTNDSSE
jgi:hypothetical protein